jgi:hypothetical protein
MGMLLHVVDHNAKDSYNQRLCGAMAVASTASVRKCNDRLAQTIVFNHVLRNAAMLARTHCVHIRYRIWLGWSEASTLDSSVAAKQFETSC